MRGVEMAGGLVIVGAVGLAALLAAPWYGAEVTAFGDIDINVNAWNAFERTDIAVLVLAAVAALAIYTEWPGVSLVAAMIAMGLIVYRIVDTPGDIPGTTIEVEWGAWVALAAAAVMALAALVIVIEERSAP